MLPSDNCCAPCRFYLCEGKINNGFRIRFVQKVLGPVSSATLIFDFDRGGGIVIQEQVFFYETLDHWAEN